ncbi:unnamed protein product, partial [Rotaria sordida]
QCVSELLTERTAQFGLLLDDISITNLSFRPEFTSAVELKRRFLVEKKQKGNQNYINARFRSPFANYLPHLALSQIATAHFQLVLSR